MAIIGNEIPPYVQTQITKRQEFHGSGVAKNRTPEQIHYLNSNTSWIKLASGVYVTTNGVGSSLAKNNVLFNGTSMFNGSSLTQKNGFDETYQYSEFGPVPMAGIISADVKALNRGSLKKSTVKIKAHNKDQFDAIDVLYMRIGYTVMLEWGNTFYLDKNGDVQEIHNTLIEDIFFSFSSDGDYTFVLPFIEGKREKYCGNYDALLGRISNFDWAFNPDGSYDITLTILSLGDVVESLKTDISVDSKTTTFLKEARKSNQSISGNSVILEKNKDDNLITSMLWLWTYFNPPPQPAVSSTNSNIITTNLAGNTNVEKALRFFIDNKGYPKWKAAGIVAALMGEAGINLDPQIVNPRSGAYGLAQWLGSRRTNLNTVAGARANTLEGQLDFVYLELQPGTPYTDSLADNQIAQATNAEEMLAAMATFERWGYPVSLVSSLGNYQKVYELMKQEVINKSSPDRSFQDRIGFLESVKQLIITLYGSF